MKNISKTFAVVLGIAANTSLFAQRGNDPTYSIHNYKHPNKAAEIKRENDKKPAVYLEEVETESAQTNDNLSAGMKGNYKMMNTGNFDFKIFKVTKAPLIIPFSAPQNENYKQQFPARVAPKSQPLPVIKKEEPVV